MDADSPITPSPAGASRRLGWRTVLIATVLAASAAAAVLVFAPGDGATVDAAAPGLELRPADEVPAGDPLDIGFTTTDGGSSTLRDVLDGPTVVNFFASWCAPCIAELPDLQEVATELDGEVTFFGLAVTDRPEDAADIIERTGVTYGWGRDVRGDVSGAAGVFQMPTTLFIDADGTIVKSHGGAVDADRLRALIEEHLGT